MVTAALKRFWSGGHGEAGGEAGGATTVAVKPGLWTRLSTWAGALLRDYAEFQLQPTKQLHSPSQTICWL